MKKEVVVTESLFFVGYENMELVEGGCEVMGE